MVALPKLLNCCACASLKTGTLIIGSLGVVASVILLIVSISFMAGSTALIGLWVEDPMDQEAISSEQSGIFIIGVGALLGSIFSTVITACLVHGARTRNVCFMKPWINLSVIELILNFFNIIRALTSLSIVDIICSILGWVLGAYFFLVVWNFKKEIEDEVGAGGDQDEVHYKGEEKV